MCGVVRGTLPRMPSSHSVYVADHRLSSSELQCAVLDGELVALGEGFLPIDAPETAHARAASLAPLVIDSRVIISDRSAAWVWGWGPMPRTVATCVSIAARIPSPDRRRLRAREVVIGDAEQIALGDVASLVPCEPWSTSHDTITATTSSWCSPAVSESTASTPSSSSRHWRAARTCRSCAQRVSASMRHQKPPLGTNSLPASAIRLSRC